MTLPPCGLLPSKYGVAVFLSVAVILSSQENALWFRRVFVLLAQSKSELFTWMPAVGMILFSIYWNGMLVLALITQNVFQHSRCAYISQSDWSVVEYNPASCTLVVMVWKAAFSLEKEVWSSVGACETSVGNSYLCRKLAGSSSLLWPSCCSALRNPPTSAQVCSCWAALTRCVITGGKFGMNLSQWSVSTKIHPLMRSPGLTGFFDVLHFKACCSYTET